MGLSVVVSMIRKNKCDISCNPSVHSGLDIGNQVRRPFSYSSILIVPFPGVFHVSTFGIIHVSLILVESEVNLRSESYQKLFPVMLLELVIG